MVQKIRRRLSKDARDKELGADEGSIYMYQLAREHKQGIDMWKVGQTSRAADVRLAEWAESHKQEVVLCTEWHVLRGCKWLERLTHAYLDRVRVLRYEDGAQLHSFWYDDGKPVNQRTDTEQGRVDALHKHTEWFCAPRDEIEGIICSIIGAFGLARE